MSRSRARRGSRAALAAAVTVGALLGSASPAAAHTRLESSDPSAGQQLQAAPEQVRLVFSSGIDDRFARVALTPAGGSAQELAVAVDGEVLVAQVPADASGDAGEWRIDFRVVSADGHPVSGSVPFEVRAAGAATSPSGAAPAAQPSAVAAPDEDLTARPAAAADEDRTPVWPWAVGGVLLVGGGLLALRRRRPSDG